MSPALLKKYLAAARLVADHVVLKPEGFVFAPHPVVTDTDRDKYCVQRIIDFYERHGRLRRLFPGRLEVSPSRRSSAEPDAELSQLRDRGGAECEVSVAGLVGPDRGRGGSGAAGRRPADVERAAGPGQGGGGPRRLRADARPGRAAAPAAQAQGQQAERQRDLRRQSAVRAVAQPPVGRAGIEVIPERFSPTCGRLADQLKDADAGLAQLFTQSETDAETAPAARRAGALLRGLSRRLRRLRPRAVFRSQRGRPGPAAHGRLPPHAGLFPRRRAAVRTDPR